MDGRSETDRIYDKWRSENRAVSTKPSLGQKYAILIALFIDFKIY